MTTCDILVLVATGFTGRLITQYLSTHPQRSSFTFSIAGRSSSKLSALLTQLSLDDDDTVKIVKVDVSDFQQVEHAVKRTKVVINSVGPFWKWGTPVVK